MKARKYCPLVAAALFALPALAWEGLVNGNRLACDFVADGIVRVQFALGDKLQDNATGVVTGDKKVSAPLYGEHLLPWRFDGHGR